MAAGGDRRRAQTQTEPVQPRLLSVLMPVYNERSYIERMVERVLSADLPDGLDRELVVVDDGSTDGTTEILDGLARQHPGVLRVFYQERNQGKGAAIARAVEQMRGDIAIFQDADLEYDPVDYPRLLKPILSGRADVVFGSRFLGTGAHRVLNYHHYLGNVLLTHLSNLTTGFNLTDMETCYKAFRADVLRTLPLRSKRFGVEPEVTAKIAKRQCLVYEVPVSYHGRSYAEGKKIGWRDGLHALWTIGKFWVIDDCFNEQVHRRHPPSLANSRRRTARLVRVIEPWLGERILHLEAGVGDVARQLPKRLQLTVSDQNEENRGLLQMAFRHFERVDVLRIDPESDVDFAALGRRYDTVVCLDVLQRVVDDRRAVERMASVLTPGGRLIAVVPQHRSLMCKLDGRLGTRRRYSADELCAKLQGAGLEVEAIFGVDRLAAVAWWINGRLLGRGRLGRLQRKIFDVLIPLESGLEAVLPRVSVGLSLVAVGRAG